MEWELARPLGASKKAPKKLNLVARGHQKEKTEGFEAFVESAVEMVVQTVVGTVVGTSRRGGGAAPLITRQSDAINSEIDE